MFPLCFLQFNHRGFGTFAACQIHLGHLHPLQLDGSRQWGRRIRHIIDQLHHSTLLLTLRCQAKPGGIDRDFREALNLDDWDILRYPYGPSTLFYKVCRTKENGSKYSLRRCLTWSCRVYLDVRHTGDQRFLGKPRSRTFIRHRQSCHVRHVNMQGRQGNFQQPKCEILCTCVRSVLGGSSHESCG